MAYILDTASNLKTLVYIVGAPTVTGCDYNFTSVGNTTEQSIQLGGTDIIPAMGSILVMSARCLDGLNGAITGTSDCGLTSGTNVYWSAKNIDDTDEVCQYGSSPPSPIVTATSVWFSFTPSANWSTITNGKWKIYITFIDNSQI